MLTTFSFHTSGPISVCWAWLLEPKMHGDLSSCCLVANKISCTCYGSIVYWMMASDMDEPKVCHTKWSKSEREKQIYINSYMRNLEKWYRWESICRAGIHLQGRCRGWACEHRGGREGCLDRQIWKRWEKRLSWTIQYFYPKFAHQLSYVCFSLELFISHFPLLGKGVKVLFLQWKFIQGQINLTYSDTGLSSWKHSC